MQLEPGMLVAWTVDIASHGVVRIYRIYMGDDFWLDVGGRVYRSDRLRALLGEILSGQTENYRHVRIM